MGEVESTSLLWWCQKIVNDPDLLAVWKQVGDKHVLVESFCNVGVQRICRGMDYDAFDGKTANEIIDYCRKNWIKPLGSTVDQMKAAHESAKVGDIAILGLEEKPRGHVAICCPGGPMIFSGHFGIYLPRVANVGKTNAIMGASYAFDKLPEVFILGKTIS